MASALNPTPNQASAGPVRAIVTRPVCPLISRLSSTRDVFTPETRRASEPPTPHGTVLDGLSLNTTVYCDELGSWVTLQLVGTAAEVIVVLLPIDPDPSTPTAVSKHVLALGMGCSQNPEVNVL